MDKNREKPNNPWIPGKLGCPINLKTIFYVVDPDFYPEVQKIESL